MATTLYCIDGTRPSYPADFLNPYGHTLLEPSSFSAGGNQRNATLRTALAGPQKNLDFASPSTIGFYKIARFYSDPLSGNQTIGNETITAYCHGFEDVGTANAEWEVEVFVIKPDNTLRGSIWHSNGLFPEMNVDSDTETSASGTGSAVNALDGDRIAVEIYYNKTGAKTEALSRLSYGTSSYDTRVVFGTSTLVFKYEQPLTETLAYSDLLKKLPSRIFSELISLLDSQSSIAFLQYLLQKDFLEHIAKTITLGSGENTLCDVYVYGGYLYVPVYGSATGLIKKICLLYTSDAADE